MLGSGNKGWVMLCRHGGEAGGEACGCALTSTGTEQSLDELEFARSASAAAQDGDVAKLRRALQRNPSAVHSGGGGGYTPLHFAARSGRLDAIHLLLQHGADPNAQTRGMGATALHRAAGQGHADVVQALLRAGADALLQDCDGETALHKAASTGYATVCDTLIAACPAAKAMLDKNGRTPAQRAQGAAAASFPPA